MNKTLTASSIINIFISIYITAPIHYFNLLLRFDFIGLYYNKFIIDKHIR